MSALARHGKRITWHRADRALLAIIDLLECDDYQQYDPGPEGVGVLDRACDVARAIRDQCKAPGA